MIFGKIYRLSLIVSCISFMPYALTQQHNSNYGQYHAFNRQRAQQAAPQPVAPAVQNQAVDADDPCSICYEEGYTVKLQCNCRYKYHSACLSEHLLVNKTCPTCRAPATGIANAQVDWFGNVTINGQPQLSNNEQQLINALYSFVNAQQYIDQHAKQHLTSVLAVYKNRAQNNNAQAVQAQVIVPQVQAHVQQAAYAQINHNDLRVQQERHAAFAQQARARVQQNPAYVKAKRTLVVSETISAFLLGMLGGSLYQNGSLTHKDKQKHQASFALLGFTSLAAQALLNDINHIRSRNRTQVAACWVLGLGLGGLVGSKLTSKFTTKKSGATV